ncbi:MAG: hypothetical protein LJE97_09730 [Betaproteobacteria bacterium]|jgi:hypothetical protein|nr:hypothetical protein [Betaproteobacteria bacterium]
MTDTAILKETPWETRNIGVPSYAVAPSFFEAPDFTGLERALQALAAKHGRLFVAARLGKGGLPQVPRLQSLGFYVVECTVSPTMVLGRNPVLRAFERDPSDFLPRRYRIEELEFRTLVAVEPDHVALIKTMARDAFEDDRFHCDYQCPREIGDRRFAFWMDDLARDPEVRFDLLILRGTPIAFFARKHSHQIVSGFARERASSGLGEFFWLSTCKAVKDEGYAAVHSLISCNNLQSLNLCARCGYRFKDTGYTFHYWMNPPGGG